jgi:hypothetical protein
MARAIASVMSENQLICPYRLGAGTVSFPLSAIAWRTFAGVLLERPG